MTYTDVTRLTEEELESEILFLNSNSSDVEKQFVSDELNEVVTIQHNNMELEYDLVDVLFQVDRRYYNNLFDKWRADNIQSIEDELRYRKEDEYRLVQDMISNNSNT